MSKVYWEKCRENVRFTVYILTITVKKLRRPPKKMKRSSPSGTPQAVLLPRSSWVESSRTSAMAMMMDWMEDSGWWSSEKCVLASSLRGKRFSSRFSRRYRKSRINAQQKSIKVNELLIHYCAIAVLMEAFKTTMRGYGVKYNKLFQYADEKMENSSNLLHIPCNKLCL